MQTEANLKLRKRRRRRREQRREKAQKKNKEEESRNQCFLYYDQMAIIDKKHNEYRDVEKLWFWCRFEIFVTEDSITNRTTV
jgi:hypothetical protein